MNDDTLMAVLREADPFAGSAPPVRRRDPHRVCAEITATDRGPVSWRGTARRRPLVRVSLAAAAGVVAVLAATLLATPWASTPAAASEAVAAARLTEARASGEVVGDIQIVSAPDGDVPGGNDGISAGFTLRYGGGDFDLTTTDGNGTSRLIGIGDDRFAEQPGTDTFAPADPGDRFLEQGFGIAAAGAGPDGLVDLVQQTGDVTVTGTDPRRFAGTVSVAALSGLDQLPPGASLFADPARLAGYPDTVAVALDVTDGALSRLQLRMLGDTPAGHTDLTVTTTFSGGDQQITAPSVEPPENGTCRITATGDGRVLESAGCQPLVQIVDDYRAENPDEPCLELDGPQRLQCLDDRGETEVAEALRSYLAALPPGNR